MSTKSEKKVSYIHTMAGPIRLPQPENQTMGRMSLTVPCEGFENRRDIAPAGALPHEQEKRVLPQSDRTPRAADLGTGWGERAEARLGTGVHDTEFIFGDPVDPRDVARRRL